MKVIAAAGTKCPKQDNPREYITDSEVVDVAETAYYMRLIADGSLVLVEGTIHVDGTPEVKSKRGGKE